ncbi:MAG: hypothetical protein GTO07_21330, partial [Pseudomonas stutzeri]|nr:hypothetical protein [Stutzerimonas stutzeri]
TLIITAAFFMGDTLSGTIRSLTLDELGEIDEFVRLESGAEAAQSPYFKFARYSELSAELDDYPLVDALVPAIRYPIPVVNTTRRKSERALMIMGLRPEDVSILEAEELTDAEGGPLLLTDLGTREVFLNAAAAEDLAAVAGDALDLYVGSRPKTVYVRGV